MALREPIELTITEAHAGQRLDRALAACKLGESRSTLQRWMEEGRVTLDGRPAAAKTRLRGGERVVVRPAPRAPSAAVPEPIPLVVLYEDEQVLVLDKPAGMVVHPAPGHDGGTLVNALLHHASVDDGGDAQRPGIVHRLDKDTSGILVVAKTAAAREALIAQFKLHDIERRYLAIAVGAPPDRVTYDTFHGRHPRDRKRFTSKVREGKRAVTRVRVLERLHGAALVECTLETGRTHQIRVHLAEHGFPLLGDPIYGRASRDPRLRAAAATLGGQALHAAVLGFKHPIGGHALRFECPPHAAFRLAVKALREPEPACGVKPS